MKRIFAYFGVLVLCGYFVYTTIQLELLRSRVSALELSNIPRVEPLAGGAGPNSK